MNAVGSGFCDRRGLRGIFDSGVGPMDTTIDSIRFDGRVPSVESVWPLSRLRTEGWT
jgi:hypothetical protein